ncbi:MAG: DUF1624 domain-containing protein [Clostridiales bacterium]|nr:DUF1624 domain-containing protein [Clostridiales bacterium]
MQTATAVNAIYRDKRRRVWELDFLRGVAVIAMLVDHLMYDFAALDGWLSNFFKVNNPFITFMNEFAEEYWYSTFRGIAHPIFVFLFLFLVGTSCALSRDNVKRGSLLSIVALAFTGVTMILREMGIMTYGVVFGILDCIALSILIAAAVDIATKRVKWLNIALPLVLGVIILSFGIANRFWYTHDKWEYVFHADHLTSYIMGARAYGDDWFGVFPWVGMVLVGMYWGKAVYGTRISLLPMLDGAWNKPFKFVGRHALIFYIAHQVLLTGLVMLLCLCLGYEIGF